MPAAGEGSFALGYIGDELVDGIGFA